MKRVTVENWPRNRAFRPAGEELGRVSAGAQVVVEQQVAQRRGGGGNFAPGEALVEKFFPSRSSSHLSCIAATTCVDAHPSNIRGRKPARMIGASRQTRRRWPNTQALTPTLSQREREFWEETQQWPNTQALTPTLSQREREFWEETQQRPDVEALTPTLSQRERGFWVGGGRRVSSDGGWCRPGGCRS